MLRSTLDRLKRITESETQVRDDLLINVLRPIPVRFRPNHLTGIRLVISLVLFLPRTIDASTALLVLVIGIIGDMTDGVLARKRDQVTTFGKFLDPMADKILAIGLLYYLYVHGAVELALIGHVILPETVYVLYIIGMKLDRRIGVPTPSLVGRGKVACYFIGFGIILIGEVAGLTAAYGIGTGLVVAGILLAWLAQLGYAYEAVRTLASGRRSTPS